MERRRPLIAVVCSVPVLAEAVASSLDFGDVRVFSARDGDLVGLLTWLRPDAAVVDTDAAAAEAAEYAAAADVPVVHVGVREATLRLYQRGWRVVADASATAEGIRNLVAGTLFARETRLP